MRHQELEEWVLRVAALVSSGVRSEDSRVELKREWPDAQRAARRIAGHCNANVGDDVLWIIGLGEDGTTSPQAQPEFADWWPQVMSFFDQLPPSVTHLVIPFGTASLDGLLFDTSRAPFVVRNPEFGRPGGGSMEREVPWREGTAIRSARRDDLIRILVPLSRIPSFEYRRAKLHASAGPRTYEPTTGHFSVPDPPEVLDWELRAEFYVVPQGRDRIVLPNHLTSITISVDPGSLVVADTFHLAVPMLYDIGDTRKDSHTMLDTTHELIVDGPGLVEVSARLQTPFVPEIASASVIMTLKAGVLNSARDVVITLRSGASTGRAEWNTWRVEVA